MLGSAETDFDLLPDTFLRQPDNANAPELPPPSSESINPIQNYNEDTFKTACQEHDWPQIAQQLQQYYQHHGTEKLAAKIAALPKTLKYDNAFVSHLERLIDSETSYQACALLLQQHYLAACQYIAEQQPATKAQAILPILAHAIRLGGQTAIAPFQDLLTSDMDLEQHPELAALLVIEIMRQGRNPLWPTIDSVLAELISPLSSALLTANTSPTGKSILDLSRTPQFGQLNRVIRQQLTPPLSTSDDAAQPSEDDVTDPTTGDLYYEPALTECGHRFERESLVEWLLQNSTGEDNDNPTCPQCRTPITLGGLRLDFQTLAQTDYLLQTNPELATKPYLPWHLLPDMCDPQVSDQAIIAFLAQKNPTAQELLQRLDDEGRNLLHRACALNRKELVTHLVTHHPDSLNAVDQQGRTPAMQAAEKQHWDCLLQFPVIATKKHSEDAKYPQALRLALISGAEEHVILHLLKSAMNVDNHSLQIPATIATQQVVPDRIKPTSYTLIEWAVLNHSLPIAQAIKQQSRKLPFAFDFLFILAVSSPAMLSEMRTWIYSIAHFQSKFLNFTTKKLFDSIERGDLDEVNQLLTIPVIYQSLQHPRQNQVAYQFATNKNQTAIVARLEQYVLSGYQQALAEKTIFELIEFLHLFYLHQGVAAVNSRIAKLPKTIRESIDFIYLFSKITQPHTTDPASAVIQLYNDLLQKTLASWQTSAEHMPSAVAVSSTYSALGLTTTWQLLQKQDVTPKQRTMLIWYAVYMYLSDSNNSQNTADASLALQLIAQLPDELINHTETYRGFSLLHLAGQNRRPSIAASLIQRGANCDLPSEEGLTPRDLAELHRLDTIPLNPHSSLGLAKEVVNLWLNDDNPYFLSILNRLSDADKKCLRESDVRGKLALKLSEAICNNQLTVIRALHQLGIDVNTPLLQDEPSPLEMAIGLSVTRGGPVQLETLTCLLECGGDPTRDSRSSNLLFQQVEREDTALVECIARHLQIKPFAELIADINNDDTDDATAGQYLRDIYQSYGQSGLRTALLKISRDLSANCFKPFLTITGPLVTHVHIMLEIYCTPEMDVPENGLTFCLLAVIAGHIDIVKALLIATEVDNRNERAIELAEQHQQPAIANLIRQYQLINAIAQNQIPAQVDLAPFGQLSDADLETLLSADNLGIDQAMRSSIKFAAKHIRDFLATQRCQLSLPANSCDRDHVFATLSQLSLLWKVITHCNAGNRVAWYKALRQQAFNQFQTQMNTLPPAQALACITVAREQGIFNEPAPQLDNPHRSPAWTMTALDTLNTQISEQARAAITTTVTATTALSP